MTAKFFKKDGPVRRSEYRSPDYFVDHVDLFFEIISFSEVRVRSVLKMRPGSTESKGRPVILNKGPQISKFSLSINEKPLQIKNFPGGDSCLELPAQGGEFTLSCEHILNPAANKHGKGLYKSRKVLVTQNESRGFRDITLFPDRPDILCTWTTHVTASKKDFPVLLATGDRIDYKENNDGTHTATFASCEYRMPSYLYALVVGNFDCLEDQILMDGDNEPIKLLIYVPPGKCERAKIAMSALKMAMGWDMKHFGRKYPLKQFRIVAVDDFNAGAMENFGLNIFNAGNLLGDLRVALDVNLINIATTVEHEYGHTWRGDLVTVRTWHEIALKEGFQSLMDNLFEETLLGETVAKIRRVRHLRMSQFPKDAGSTAHNIWPEEYEGDPSASMYTVITYEKGAEVIGMVRTLVGEEKFRIGTDKYFNDFYGKAATIDDLINCLEAAGGLDLKQFKNWFTQIGTPQCYVEGHYDEAKRTFSLVVSQKSGRGEVRPLHFPFGVGFVGPDGEKVHLELVGDSGGHDLERGILSITRESEVFVFKNVPKGSVPSLLRGFSAPVKLYYEYSNEELLHLMKFDSDGFNRYEAGYRIARQELNRLISLYKKGEFLKVDFAVLAAYGGILFDLMDKDSPLAAEMLVLPDESELVQDMEVYDFEAAKLAKDSLRVALAEKYKDRFLKLYHLYQDLSCKSEQEPVSSVINVDAIQKRKVKNVCLAYLEEVVGVREMMLIKEQFEGAKNMTDEFSALRLLLDIPAEREQALEAFYKKWSHEELVINRWLMAQGWIDDEEVVARVRGLSESSLFDIDKPGHVYSLMIFGFVGNHVYFHKKSGEGYVLVADIVLKCGNSDVSCRLLEGAFGDLPRMDRGRQALMRKQLKRIIGYKGVLEDVKKRAEKVMEG